MTSQRFEPQRVKQQLASKLGLSPQAAVIEPHVGNAGGMNEGIWTLRDQTQSFILKLVKGHGKHGFPTEGEKFFKLCNEHPLIINDPSLAFPVKIFKCMAPGSGKRYELIVMRKVTGTMLSEVIAKMICKGELAQLNGLFSQLGAFLADFQARYGHKHHGDFQPSNIFLCAPSSPSSAPSFTLIDVADMGPRAPPFGTAESDAEHFIAALGILSKCYGQHFYLEGKRQFEMGYARGRR